MKSGFSSNYTIIDIQLYGLALLFVLGHHFVERLEVDVVATQSVVGILSRWHCCQRN